MIGALGHVTTTIILSLVISTMGNTLISEDLYNIACLIILLSLAGYYLFSYAYQGRRDATACCASTSCEEGINLTYSSSSNEINKQVDDEKSNSTGVSNFAALSVISLTTFSPCLGSMPMTLSLLNPPVQAITVVKLWMTLVVVATCVMMTLVIATFVGVRYAVLSKVKRHERLLLGVTLIVLAAVTYSMNSHEHHHHDNGKAVHQTMMKDGQATSTSCSHGHHHHHHHHGHGHEHYGNDDHGHGGGHEKEEGEVMRDAEVVKGDMNIVINGQRQKFGAKDEDDKTHDEHDEGR